jgi:hypothetical protein
VLYVAGEFFGCRSCYELAYASQQQSPMFRSLRQSQKIRLRLGGDSDPFESFPEKPRGIHQRTYSRVEATAYCALDSTSGSKRAPPHLAFKLVVRLAEQP